MERTAATAWSRPTKCLVGVGLAICGIFLLLISRSMIPLLLVAGLLAFMVRPVIGLLHERLRRCSTSRPSRPRSPTLTRAAAHVSPPRPPRSRRCIRSRPLRSPHER